MELDVKLSATAATQCLSASFHNEKWKKTSHIPKLKESPPIKWFIWIALITASLHSKRTLHRCVYVVFFNKNCPHKLRGTGLVPTPTIKSILNHVYCGELKRQRNGHAHNLLSLYWTIDCLSYMNVHFRFILFSNTGMFYLHEYSGSTWIPGDHGGQKSVLDPLELELQVVVILGAGK